MAETSRLVCYNSKQIHYVWARVAPHIQRALDTYSAPNYTLDEIFLGLSKAEFQLWVWQGVCRPTIHAAMVTAIQNDKDTKFCLLLAAGGEKMDEWYTHLPVVEEWARENGCAEMRIYGRIGWARQLDYDVIYTKMRKRLWQADQTK